MLLKNFKYSMALLFSVLFMRSYYLSGMATTIPLLLVCLLFPFYVKIDKKFIIGIILLVFLLFQSLITDNSFIGIIKVVGCFLFALCFFTAAEKLNSRGLLWNVNFFIKASIVFLFIECVGRLFFNDYFVRSDINAHVEPSDVDVFFNYGFYYYKLSSPFFRDSNFTALFAFPVILLCLFFYDHIRSCRLYIFLLFVILLFTISRTAYIVFLATLFIFMLNRHFSKISLAIMTIIIALPITAVLYFSILNVNDGSFSTKVEIWLHMLDVVNNISLMEFLFGVGFENGKYLISYTPGAAAHALIPQLLGEIGLFGMILYFSAILFAVIKNRFLLLGFFSVNLFGLSLFDPWEPIYWAIFGFIAGAPKVIREL